MDPLALGLAGLAAALAVALALSRVALSKAARRADAAEAELAALKTGPRQVEQRIERFELLWFPALSVREEPPHVLSVTAGLPYCRACVAPLKLQAQGDWACLECGARHPGSLADTMVMDAVGQQALKEFLQRHKGYRLAPKPL